MARAKLVNHRDIDANHGKFSLDASMAVLDVQLSLDFEPRRQKVQLDEASLVESHMRFAYSIPHHREYLRSGYPSEPLLAEAAAQQLKHWRSEKPFVVVDTLTDILKSGLLSRGELGELTGRQLLLDAYHRAVEAEQDTPNFSAGCRLTTFIKMLFTEEYAQEFLNSEPENVTGKPFKEAFATAMVCFTHFGKMADHTGTTTTAVWAAFMRHMAIMCMNGQEAVDCIIPVLLWDTRLCEHVMTGMLVQLKRRLKAGTVAKYTIDAAKLGFFPTKIEMCGHGSVPESETKALRPYVSLIMELGIQSDPMTGKKKSDGRPRTPPKAKSADQEPATPSRIHIPQRGTRHHNEIGHARYTIFAYGCSNTVYQGIDAAHKASYALLLNSRDFLGEHPRQSPQTLKAVRRMKPFWSRGEDSYHWIERNDILHGDDPHAKKEFLVGKECS